MASTDETKDEEPASLRDVARRLDTIGLPRLVVSRALEDPRELAPALGTLRTEAKASAQRHALL